MEEEDISRRLFIVRSLIGVSGAWLFSKVPDIVAAQEHVHSAVQSASPPKLTFFSPEQAAQIEAMAARIIPTDDTPGAREARVIYFIDYALSNFDKDKQPLYLKGLKRLDARVGRRGASGFAALGVDRQDKLLKEIEKTKFFETVRAHTVMGFFSNPEYGGNHDLVGWKLIGFEDRFFYKPPFGYYDAGGQ